MVTMNNKFIKRFGKMILNAVVLLGFMACGNNVSAVNDKKSENSENGKKDKGKVLVVYFSQTGTTEGVAKIIARETDADLIKLEVKNEYTRDDLNWNDKNSRVNREHDNPNNRSVELKNAVISNFASYDTVYIGYPIWWGEASWVLDDFVKKNDFTEKTVIPFGTSMSTGDGTSGDRLKKLTKTGNWIAGQRFSSSYNETEVVNWVKGLKY
jgi:hypothetical protein